MSLCGHMDKPSTATQGEAAKVLIIPKLKPKLYLNLFRVRKFSSDETDPFRGRDSKPVLFHFEAALLTNVPNEILETKCLYRSLR